MADIVFVGEAPGEQEHLLGQPFVGPSGQELTRMMRDAGILRSESYLTNVFKERPPNNDITAFCGKRAEVPKDYPFPPLSQGNYVLPKYLDQLSQLQDELAQENPSVIVALGNTALWALCGVTGITKYRGTVMLDSHGRKILPTFHPAAVLRQWTYRVVVVADLLKAARESQSRELSVPNREIWIEPTISDLYQFMQDFIYDRELLSVDIETARNSYITCIGFSPCDCHALVVPFVDFSKPSYHYWEDPQDELHAWMFCNHLLTSPQWTKLGQNFSYDLQYLLKAGIPVRNYREDTMLRHHAMFPELPKDLRFMGSIYTNEIAWKNMKPKGHKMEKREE